MADDPANVMKDPQTAEIGNAIANARAAAARRAAEAGSLIPTRAQVEAFLQLGMATMRSSATRELLKDPAVERPGLKLIEIQRAGWDVDNIDTNVGCQTLDELEVHWPGDTELVMTRIKFIETAQLAYVQVIEDRRPKKLERKKPMTRDKMIEFFDVCNTKMDLPDFQQVLAKHLTDTKQVPNKLIQEMQRDYLEIVGYEREHGCRDLSQVPQRYKEDKEMMYRFTDWTQRATRCCMMIVKEFQKNGGQLAEQHQGTMGDNSVLHPFMAQAQAEVAKMSAEDRGAHLQKMSKKMDVMQKLTNEDRQEYMNKLPESEKIEFAKAHILFMSVIRQQFEARQQQEKQAAEKAAGYDSGQTTTMPTGAPTPSPGVTERSANAPSQQEMMS